MSHSLLAHQINNSRGQTVQLGLIICVIERCIICPLELLEFELLWHVKIRVLFRPSIDDQYHRREASWRA